MNHLPENSFVRWVLRFGLAWLGWFGVTAAMAADPTYYFRLIVGPDQLFTLPAPAAERVFRDARSAIELVEVKCNGRVALPVATPAVADPPADTIVSAPPGVIMYTMPDDGLACWNNLTPGASARELRAYPLHGSNVIEIVYRVRYPNGKTAGTFKAVFTWDETPASRIKFP